MDFLVSRKGTHSDSLQSEQAESGLRFLGLVIFENKLKPGTTPAIHSLRAAHLACRMITGDNPLTAVSVARECGLISEAAHVFTPAFIRGTCDILCTGQADERCT
jgi:cation-transporting ATPase 13A2